MTEPAVKQSETSAIAGNQDVRTPEGEAARSGKFRAALRKVFVDPFTSMVTFLRESLDEYGLMFMVMIGFVFFLHGFRQYVFGDAFDWFYRKQFRLDPGVVQSYRSTANITWNIKMLYGLLFDNFPLFRRHHQPWMLVSALVSLVGFIGLGLPEMSNTPDATLGYFWLALMSMAMSNVIADAMVVKRARLAGQRGGANLQTFCWIMLYIGSIIGRPTSGTITGSGGQGSRDLMKYAHATTSGLLFIVACFLTEDPTNVKWSLKRAGHQVWRLIKGVLFNMKVLLPMTWIVLSNAIVPDVSSAMAYWKLDVVDIGADTQSYIDTAADLFAMLGLALYALYFKSVSFRVMFGVTQFVSGAFLIFDCILYNRWNVKIGIPDIWFMMGSDSVYYILSQVQAMPFLIMAAQLCPSDIEASFFATLTSLSNAGSNASTRWGGFLLNKLGVVSSGRGEEGEVQIDYTNLGKALWIRVGLAFVPLLLIWMVPNTSVVDGADEEEKDENDKEVAGKMEEGTQKSEKWAEVKRMSGLAVPQTGQRKKSVS
ncbi:hypothetical protein HK102_004722 [Quaeritorhiza haematococci]|nr:hypothetical protein HK102_004722 [Quaeritorhiza haematococci]